MKDPLAFNRKVTNFSGEETKMFSIDDMTFDGGDEVLDPNDLTGEAEHLRDEAHECGEYTAMREEANREHALEAAMAESEAEEDAAEDVRRYPGGRCILDDDGRLFPRTCETRDDDIFF